MRRILLAVSAVAFGLSCSGPVSTPNADAGDWPAWRGPNRDEISTETGLLPAGLPVDLRRSGLHPKPGSVIPVCPWLVMSSTPWGPMKQANRSSRSRPPMAQKSGPHRSANGWENGWGDGPRSTPAIRMDSWLPLAAKGTLSASARLMEQ